jgi:hypothetical protein
MFFIAILTLLSPLALMFVKEDVVLWLYVFGVGQIFLIFAALDEPALVRTRNAIGLYSLCLAVISILSYSNSITIGTPIEPYLAKSDGQGYFAEAMWLRDGNIFAKLSLSGTNYLGYQFILALAFRLLSPDLIIGLLVNNTALLLAVVLLARTTFLLTGDARPAFFSALAFMLTSKFIFYANVLLKDPLLLLGVALVAYAFVNLRMKRSGRLAAYGSLLGAVMIFGTMRLPMLVLIPGGFTLLGREFLRKGWILVVAGIIGASALGSVFASFTTHEFSKDAVAQQAVQNSILDEKLQGGGASAGGVVGRIMGGYTELTLWERVISVPVPTIIQFALPFDFWSTRFLDDHMIDFFNTNLNPLWYLFVGVFAIYTAVYWRQLPNWPMKALFFLGLAMYVVIAFIFGGVVPRYASPYLILMFPAIGYQMTIWWLRARRASSIRTFFGLYYFLFGTASAAYVLFQLSRTV